MYSYATKVVSLLLVSASVANAALTIINHCTTPLYIKEAHSILRNGCDMGPDKSHCYSDPWVVKKGATMVLKTYNDYANGTAVKISRNWAVDLITQFEYTPSDNLYWDVSDLDGQGSGRVGSPFQNDNIMAEPVGDRGGKYSCKPVLCQKNQVCDGAYQHPEQKATRACGAWLQDYTFTFCVDDATFAAEKANPDNQYTPPSKRAVVFVS